MELLGKNFPKNKSPHFEEEKKALKSIAKMFEAILGSRFIAFFF
jgi:hypothetical protein